MFPILVQWRNKHKVFVTIILCLFLLMLGKPISKIPESWNSRTRRERKWIKLFYITNTEWTQKLSDAHKIALLAEVTRIKPRRSHKDEITIAELITPLTFYKNINYFSQVSPKEQGRFLVAHQAEAYRAARILLEMFLWEWIWLPGGAMNDKWGHS